MTRFYVSNLAPTVTEEELNDLFGEYGDTFACIAVDRESGVSRGYGHVEMVNVKEATYSLREEEEEDGWAKDYPDEVEHFVDYFSLVAKELDGKHLYGQAIHVALAETCEERPYNPVKVLEKFLEGVVVATLTMLIAWVVLGIVGIVFAFLGWDEPSRHASSLEVVVFRTHAFRAWPIAGMAFVAFGIGMGIVGMKYLAIIVKLARLRRRSDRRRQALGMRELRRSVGFSKSGLTWGALTVAAVVSAGGACGYLNPLSEQITLDSSARVITVDKKYLIKSWPQQSASFDDIYLIEREWITYVNDPDDLPSTSLNVYLTSGERLSWLPEMNGRTEHQLGVALAEATGKTFKVRCFESKFRRRTAVPC